MKLHSHKIAFKKIRFLLILLSILFFPLFLGEYVPYSVKSFLYSLSLSMKSILLFLLPFIIFSFLFFSLINLKSGVIKFISLLIGMVFISNITAIFIGFTSGSLLLPKLAIQPHSHANGVTMLTSLWNFELPKLIPNQYALFAGFILGVFFSFVRSDFADQAARKLHIAATSFLKYVFTPLLPLFILGFVFKLEQDQVLEKALRSFGPVFFIVIGTQIIYVLFLYFLVAKFSFKRFLIYLRNILPASITGFSTSSSAASMPALILCTEKNLHYPEMAEMVIPATINVHTLGSAIAIPILSLATLLAFGHSLPALSEFFQFGLYFALAKFGVAAVPGGAILVVSPLLEAHLHFTSEMIGLITAIYMLFDPFGTATNVTGNGFFAIAFSKIYHFKFKEGMGS